MTLNCFDHYEDTDTKRLQVIYLSEVKKLPPKKISEYVDYAVSTIRNYIWKFKDMLSRAIALFEKGIETVFQIKKEYYAYIMNILSKNKLMYLKIGYSCDPKRRAKEHLKRYGATDVEIVKLYKFDNDDDGYTMENVLRKYFKSKDGSIFIPRDRFQNIRCTNEDIEILDNKYDFVLNNF